MELIAEVIPQGSEDSRSPDLIGVYLCKASASAHMSGEEKWDILEYITLMTPTEPVPNRKLVVYLPQDGTYRAMDGPILNPVEGDYSTGRFDPANARPLNCNPEPRHCRWKYWESSLDRGDWRVPRFHCLQVFGEWWIVEVDLRRVGQQAAVRYQQVAALDFADTPDHNFGIHAEKRPASYWIRRDPDSEFSKVVRENLTPGTPWGGNRS